MSPKPSLHDPVLGPLTDDLLTRDYRVFQRAKGHRFSSDDVATAYVAWHAAKSSRRVIDLGCGLGSVLLHLAWKLPEATLVGVEAQAISFELLRRNVERNLLLDRVTVHHGDLRDEPILAAAGEAFDLVTGTPPYFPPDTAVDAMDEQRAYARIEYRGGVEDYLSAGGRLLAPEGVMVLCGDPLARARARPRRPSEHVDEQGRRLDDGAKGERRRALDADGHRAGVVLRRRPVIEPERGLARPRHRGQRDGVGEMAAADLVGGTFQRRFETEPLWSNQHRSRSPAR